MLLKLARSGMKGRKKESFLLGLVIFLSIIFVMTSTILHTSNQTAKEKEGKASFGPWENGYFQVTSDAVEDIVHKQAVKDYGLSFFLGQTPHLGLVGTYNDDFHAMTGLQMVEGHMPKQVNEVAIEHQAIANYPYDLAIGDEINMPISITLQDISSDQVLIEQLKRIKEDIITNKTNIFAIAQENKAVTTGSIKMDTYFKRQNTPIDATNFDATVEALQAYITSLENEDDDLAAYLGYKVISLPLKIQELQRYVLDTDTYKGQTVNLKTYYSYHYSDLITKAKLYNPDPAQGINGDLDFQDNIEHYSSVTNIELIFNYTLKVTGFYENHSKYWDLDDHRVASAYVMDDLYYKMTHYTKDNSLVDMNKYLPLQGSDHTKANVLITSKHDPWTYFKTFSKTYPTLKTNSYTYPKDDFASEKTITYAILTMVFIATIIAVFQINFSQLKRRSKKFTLLKAIGMVKGQMLVLLFWEILILILLAFPLGILIGLAISYGLVALINTFSDITLIFALDTSLTAFGLLASFVSVLLGMSFPVLKAIHTPLRGDMNPPPKRSKAKTRVHHRAHSQKTLGFWSISWAYMVHEKKKNLISLTLYTIAITVLLITLCLSFVSFDRYKDEVLATHMPDYTFNVTKGLGNRQMQKIQESFDQTPEVISYDFIKFAKDAYINHPNFKTESLFQSFYKDRMSLNPDLYLESTYQFLEESIQSNIYGINSQSDMWPSLTADMSKIDLERFENGQGVLVLLPRYNSETTHETYDYRDRFKYNNHYPLKVGDTLQFAMSVEPMSSIVLTNAINQLKFEYRFSDQEILALGHHMGKEGVWPFSKTLDKPIIVTSMDNFHKLYPFSNRNWSPPAHELKTMIATQFPTGLANTIINVYTKDSEASPALLEDLQEIGIILQAPLTLQHVEKKNIFSQALKLAAIILTLGLSIALILLMVLYNTSQSKIENERSRIGILQALGVTKKQFKRLYFFTGLAFGLLAITIAHVTLGVIILAMSLAQGGPFMTALESVLWLYPLKIHIIVLGLYLVLAISTYYMPLRKAINNQPIYNINTNQR